MAGIFDAIFGNNSGAQPSTTQDPAAAAVMNAPAQAAAPAAAPQTDEQGLTSGDRFQAGMSGLSQLGATLLAAGQPMYGADRARILAQLGNVPEAITQSLNGSLARKKAAQGMKVTDAQLKAQAAMQEMANADMTGLSPEMQKLMKAAFLSGKPEVAASILKQAHEQMKPVNMGQSGVAYRKADGTYELLNPIMNTRTPLGGNGQPAGDTYYGNDPNAKFDPADLEPDPATGNLEKWLAKQPHAQSPGYNNLVKSIANGDMAMPTVRQDPRAVYLKNDVLTYTNGQWREQDHDAKKQAIKATTNGGKDYENIMRPSMAYLEHAGSLADVTDKLVARGVLGDSTLSVMGGNAARVLLSKATSPEDRQLISRWNELKSKVADEANKFTRGNGGLTDQAQREGSALKEAYDPATIKGRLSALNDIMHGQLGTVAASYKNALKKPSMQPVDLLQPPARAAYNRVSSWVSDQSRGGGSPSASAGGSSPSPADVAYLKANPGMRARFEKQFGAGSASGVLGE